MPIWAVPTGWWSMISASVARGWGNRAFHEPSRAEQSRAEQLGVGETRRREVLKLGLLMREVLP